MKQRTRRLLALDVRPRRFGYAVFEMPMGLMDCGVKRFESAEAGATWVDSLFAGFRPSVLVLRTTARRSRRDVPRTREVLHLLHRAAQRASVQTAFVSERMMKNYFCARGQRTKYQVAGLLANALPELLWKLPSPRKPWQPEHWTMLIFDAVALAVAHIALQPDAESAAQLSTGPESPFAGPSVA